MNMQKFDDTTPNSALPKHPHHLRPSLSEEWFLVAIIVATICIYLPSLSGPFLFDDIPAIQNNQAIKETPNLENLMDIPSQGPLSGRPLVALTFHLNYKAFGLSPYGYKITNLIIHILNVFLVFKILIELAPKIGRHSNCIAFVAISTAVWALHPINTESVAYTTQRTELMAGTFVLASVAFYLRSHNSSRKTTFVTLSILSGMAGALCKESAAMIPLAIALLDRAFFFTSWKEAYRERKLCYLGLLTVWAVSIPIIMSEPRALSAGLGHGMSSFEYLQIQAIYIPFYFKTLIWPDPLLIHHPMPNWDSAATYVWPTCFWLTIIFLFIRFGLRSWKFALPFLMSAILLGPSSSIIPIISEVAADRRMYLPSIVVIVVLVFCGLRITRFGIYALITASLLFATRTSLRSFDYQSPITLWQQVVDHNPDNIASLSGLADAYYLNGQESKALEIYEKSFENNKGLISSVINTAKIRLRSSDPRIRNLEQAHLLAELSLETVSDENNRVSNTMKIETFALLAETSIATSRPQLAMEAIKMGSDLAANLGRSDLQERFAAIKGRVPSQ